MKRLDFNGRDRYSIPIPHPASISFWTGETHYTANFTYTIWHKWFGWKTDVQVRCFLTGKLVRALAKKGKLLPIKLFTIKCKKTT